MAVSEIAEGDVFLTVRPSAVALHRTRPEGSPRNVFAGVVASVERQSERCRIQITGPLPLVAEVTSGAVAELNLREGVEVWASFKAVEVMTYPV